METLLRKVNNVVDIRQEAQKEFFPMVKEVEAIRDRLNTLVGFERTDKQLWEKILSERQGATEQWNNIVEKMKSLKSLVENSLNPVLSENNSLIQAYERSKRGYLNLALMGPWRQGKSKVISKLTNLGIGIIPVAGGGNCTGTTINIISNDYEGEDDVAVVYHHSVASLCEVLNEYFTLLGIPREVHVENPKEFYDFCSSRDLKKIVNECNPKEGDETYKNTLLDYLTFANEYYQELTGKVEPLKNLLQDEKTQNRFFSLVTFRTAPNNPKEQHKTLAIQKAEVYTKFRLLGEDVGKVQILDTPGIGEKRISVDKALKEALHKNVDIAIAVNAVESTTKGMAEVEKFHNILKKELYNRGAEDFLFYLFNLWSSVLDAAKVTDPDFSPKNTIETKMDKVLQHLGGSYKDKETNKVYHGIALDDSHVEVIDCVKDQQLMGFNGEDAIMSEDEGIAPFIHNILSIMASAISDVDDKFYAAARLQYRTIKNDWAALLNDMKQLPLPSYSGVIDDVRQQTEHLHDVLNAWGSKNVDLVKGIKTNVETFCNEGFGTEVSKVFNVANVRNVEEGDSDAVYTLVSKEEQSKITQANYSTRNEFIQYSELKNALCNMVLHEVSDTYIDETTALETLKEVRDEFYDILREDGRFGLVVEGEGEEFSSNLINLLVEDGCYPKLLSRIVCIKEFKLDSKDKLKPIIEGVIYDSSHYDDFGDYGFDTYENAFRSFIHSLCTIEMTIKGSLSDNSFEKHIRMIQTAFDTIYMDLIGLASFDKAGKEPEIRVELRKFYTNHQDKVFANNENAKKQGLIDKWKKLTK